MCGIGGILVWRAAGGRGVVPAEDTLPFAREAASRLVTALGHRGPDGQSVEMLDSEWPPVGALVHTRLAIIDLSPAGRQPMTDPETGDCITHNGEIYNYRELRDGLQGAGLRPELGNGVWRSQTDTEVILKAYGKWGSECLGRLRGMFAFGLWDAARRRLFLARDRLGIKPLYYCAGDGFFLFASEVRALLATGLVRPRVDAFALWEFLAYQSVAAPRTLVEGVRALPPGSWLTVASDGTVETGRYWDLLENASPEARTATPAEGRGRLGEILREAVALNLVSDVPIGVFLSGGIDSSAVVALMREVGHVPQSFSVVFSEKAYDEARYARQVATRFRTNHSEILLKETDLLDQLPDALGAMDQPTGDGVNTYIVSRAVRSAGMTVALSGLGGDELFGGYPSFSRLTRAAGCLRLWGALPAGLRRQAGRTIGVLGASSARTGKVAGLAESDGTLPMVFPILRQLFSPAQRRALMAAQWGQRVEGAADPCVELLRHAYAGSPWAGSFTRISYAEARTYMHNVLLRDTDQMSMAHGLEVRVPLLDHLVVEYLMGLPDAHKRPNGTPKRLLVQSLAGLLPEEIVRRPKQGFTLPFDPWMRGALRRFCEERLGRDRIADRGILRAEEVQRLWRMFLEAEGGVPWSHLWVLVVLEEWLERNGVGGSD